MRFFFLSLLFIFTLLFPKEIRASFNRIDDVNNKFGIHLALPTQEDLESAAKLVNSSGGDWGYVTLVMEEKEMNKDKWQDVFDQARRLHLIPIIRLSSSFENECWLVCQPDEAQKWADFLDSLNWVVKNRYIVLFNEPNHGSEWGNKVDPAGYGQTALSFAKTLKNKNPDFFVMLAGFDSAAPSSPPAYEDEVTFLNQMITSIPGAADELFTYLDGWASHSYPNHGYISPPTATGRNSVRNYQWELSLLKVLGVKKDLPIFITETGWPHQEGISINKNFYSALQAASYFQTYFDLTTKDPNVIAVTPFILNYQGEPFDHFSWQKLDSKEFYLQYAQVQQISKVKGQPTQENKIGLLEPLPKKLIKNSAYQLALKIINQGQSIWDTNEGYKLKLDGLSDDFQYFFSDFSSIEPLEEKTIYLYFKTGDHLGNFKVNIGISKDDHKIITQETIWNLEIVPQVNLKLTTKLFPKRTNRGDDFRLLIYNSKQEIVFEKSNIKVNRSQGEVKQINNLIIGEQYRLVLLKPYYLPRQTFLTITQEKNEVFFKFMLPFDLNKDGAFSLTDLLQVFKKPSLFKLWWIH